MERKQYKKPDLHAPRHRSKALDFLAYPQKDPYGFFAAMKKEHPQLEQYSNSDIAKWIKEYNKLIAHEIVNNRQGVKLPEGLGVVIPGLCKLSPKTASYNIDFKASERLGVAVPYQNLHTDGYTAKIYHVSNIPRCKFKPCRFLSRAVSKELKMEGASSTYIIFPSKCLVADLFRKPKISRPSSKDIRDEGAKKRLLAVYDEFKMD